MLPFPMIAASPRPLPSASNRFHPLPSGRCHPERSEGSAFRSSLSFFFNFKLSTFNASSFLDALDAASRISPAFATLTKNTRGGVYRLPPKNLSSSFSRLFTRHSSPATKPFRIRTSTKRPRNSFRMCTSKTKHLKPFRMNTYKKTGEGGLVAQASACALCGWQVGGFPLPFDFQLSTVDLPVLLRESQVTSHGSRLPFFSIPPLAYYPSLSLHP